MAPNGFPQFSDGNVEIHFSETDEKFVLHSWQLSLHSPWFKSSLSDRSRNEGSGTMIDGKHHWIYELRFDKDSDLGTLVKKASPNAPTPTTELIPDSRLVFGTEEARAPMQNKRVRVLKAHQDILGSLYHIPPEFSDYYDFYESESPVLHLAKVAKIYGCEAIAKLYIDNHLRKEHEDVEESCANDPVSMLEFSMTVKSDWIFREAATHLLGRSNRFYDQSDDKLYELGIEAWFYKHRTTFIHRLQKCEWQMFRIQQSQESTWLSHAALNFFRQWLTEQLQAAKGSGLCPGYANLYHTISKGTFSYKVAAQKQRVRTYMNRVFENFTEENMRDLEPELKKIFTKAGAVVEPIIRQSTRRQDTMKDNFRALTFMYDELDELPWELEL